MVNQTPEIQVRQVKFTVHLKPEVLKKGLAMICIMKAFSKAPLNFNFQFFAFEKNERHMDIALIKQI